MTCTPPRSRPARAAIARPAPLLVALLLGLALPASAGDPGTVRSAQKISDWAGGFTGTLVNGDNFGHCAAGIGDLDGDGVADMAVGTPYDDDGGNAAGAIWILFLDSDGTVKGHHKISPISGDIVSSIATNDNFGFSVANLGDLDGDGVTDLAVGARLDDDSASNSGSVYVLNMKTDGTVKSWSKISNASSAVSGILAYSYFGSSVANLGDLDGDGVTDLAVGAPSDNETGGSWGVGAAWVVFLNADGTAKGAQKIDANTGGFGGVLQCNGEFGMSVAGLGDVDGDGTRDLAVGAMRNCDGCGAPCIDGQNTGAVWILFLNSNGTVGSWQKIANGVGGLPFTLEGYDFFAQSMCPVGDMDADGIVDLAVGCPQDDDGGGSSVSDRGAIYVLFLDVDGTVRQAQKISDIDGGFTGTLTDGDKFGSAVAVLGDLDGDDHMELASGARFDDDGGTTRGAVWVLFLDEGFYRNLGFGLSGVHGQPRTRVESTLVGGAPITLSLENAKASAPAFLFVSQAAIYAPMLGGVMVPNWFIPQSVAILVATDGSGELVIPDTWPAGIPSDTEYYVHYWIADAAAPMGWSASHAVRVTTP